MEQYTLENEYLKITVNKAGAELSGIMKKETGEEYLWNADARYWKRHAPVLFPIVGSLRNKEYEYQGKKYPMSQHGFARDREFELIDSEEDMLLFCLKADEQTKQVYPFDFELEVQYVLRGKNIQVQWNVKNKGNKKMYFSIGAHPAFMCPIGENGEQTEYSLKFDTKDDNLTYHLLNKDGLYTSTEYEMELNHGVCPVTKHMFDRDALIIEKNQAHEVSLMKPDKSIYLSVKFDAPLFGLWSPAGKNAPFICIEPWFGRCDSETFCGTIEEREWGNSLNPDDTYSREYSICIY